MGLKPIRDAKSFLLGASVAAVSTATLAVGVGVILGHLLDHTAETRCFGATAAMSLAPAAGGSNLATVTISDERSRDWELSDQYSGFDTMPVPLDESAGYRVIVRQVSDADDGYVKELKVRPIGETNWCGLRARTGIGY